MQTVVEKKAWNEIDVKRNIVFTLFGAIYLGAVQYAIYVEGFKRLFPAMERFCSLGLKAKLKDIEGIKRFSFKSVRFCSYTAIALLASILRMQRLY